MKGSMKEEITLRDDKANQDIVFLCDDKEMLKITPDGFYIDGEKVEDNKHRVYERFLEWIGFAEKRKA